jgi:hypothetical protein
LPDFNSAAFFRSLLRECSDNQYTTLGDAILCGDDVVLNFPFISQEVKGGSVVPEVILLGRIGRTFSFFHSKK